MTLPPPTHPDPLASVYDSSWFDAKNTELDQAKTAHQAKVARSRKKAVVVSIMSAGAYVVGLALRIDGLSIIASQFVFWIVPAMWVRVAWMNHAKKGVAPVEQAIARAALWEEVAGKGRLSRTAGPPSAGSMHPWQMYAHALERWNGMSVTPVAFTPDHPFWADPVPPDMDWFWSECIADPGRYAASARALVAASQRRHDAWLAALPRTDPQTFMAIEQLRHQRRMEAEAQRQTEAARAAAASAAAAARNSAITAQNTAAIANNTAIAARNSEITANNTAATARELEWQRRNIQGF